MPYTKDFYLPSYEELEVPELELTYSALKAGSMQYGKYCKHQNNEFMLCQKEEKDPRKCLNEGKDVTKCAFDFFNKVKKHCREEFEQYRICLWKSSADLSFHPCRNTQSVFDHCMLEKLNIPRVEVGELCEVQIHKTNRPKPTEKIQVLPGGKKEFDIDYKKEYPTPRLGYRGPT